MDCLFLGVGRLEEATQKHRRSSDVLASLSKLRGVVPSVQDVTLDLMGATLSTTHRVTCTWRNMLHRACQHKWWLALSPLL